MSRYSYDVISFWANILLISNPNPDEAPVIKAIIYGLLLFIDKYTISFVYKLKSSLETTKTSC